MHLAQSREALVDSRTRHAPTVHVLIRHSRNSLPSNTAGSPSTVLTSDSRRAEYDQQSESAQSSPLMSAFANVPASFSNPASPILDHDDESLNYGQSTRTRREQEAIYHAQLRRHTDTLKRPRQTKSALVEASSHDLTSASSPDTSISSTQSGPRSRHSASASLSSDTSTASAEGKSRSNFEQPLPKTHAHRDHRMQSILAPRLRLNGPAPWENAEGQIDEQFNRPSDAGDAVQDNDRPLPKTPRKGLAIKGLDLTKSLIKRSTTPTQASQQSQTPSSESTFDHTDCGMLRESATRPASRSEDGDLDRAPNPEHTHWQPAWRTPSPRGFQQPSRPPTAHDTIESSFSSSPTPAMSSSDIDTSFHASNRSTETEGHPIPLGGDSSVHPVGRMSLEAAQAKRNSPPHDVATRKSSEQSREEASSRTLRPRKSGILRMLKSRKEQLSLKQQSGSSATASLPVARPSPNLPPILVSPEATQSHSGPSNSAAKFHLKVPRSAPPTQVSFSHNTQGSGREPKDDRFKVGNTPSLNLRPVSMAFSDNFSRDMLFNLNQDPSSSHSGEKSKNLDTSKFTTKDSRAASPSGLSDAHSDTSVTSMASTSATSPRFTGNTSSHTPASSNLSQSLEARRSEDGAESPHTDQNVVHLKETIRRIEAELEATRKERDAALERCAQVCFSFYSPSESISSTWLFCSATGVKSKVHLNLRRLCCQDLARSHLTPILFQLALPANKTETK